MTKRHTIRRLLMAGSALAAVLFVASVSPAPAHALVNWPSSGMMLSSIETASLENYAADEITPDVSWYSNREKSFTLNSPEQLAGLAKIVNEGTLAGSSFAGKTVTLDAVINCMGVEWVPIGTTEHPFQGTFDGAGFAVRNFRITSTYENAGLFGVCGSSATLKNVRIEAGALGKVELGSREGEHTEQVIDPDTGVVTTTTVYPNAYAGGKVSCVGTLVGSCDGAIENCTSSMPVSAVVNTAVTDEQPTILDGMGGLAGRCRGNLSGSSYAGSIDVFSATATEREDDQGYLIMTCIGGVVGFFGDIDAPGSTMSTIANCTNTSTLTVNTAGFASGDRFGEVVVSQCGYVGGIAGYSTGTVRECANNGTLDTSFYMPIEIYATKIGACGSYIGGIVGGFRTDVFPGMTGVPQGALDSGTGCKDHPIYIERCTNTGSVFGHHGVGGILGNGGWYSTVIGCSCNIPEGAVVKPAEPDYSEYDDAIAAARIVIDSNTATAEQIAAAREQLAAAQAARAELKSQYDQQLYAYFRNAGGVKAARWNKPMGGGIVGKTYGNIAYCYNMSRVWSTTDGGYYIAGIAGTIFRGTDAPTEKAPTPEMWGCYNTGYAQSGLRAASLAGQNEGYMHDCYALPETSFHPVGQEETLCFTQVGTMMRCGYMEVSELQSSAGVAKLNFMADADGWENYFVAAASAGVNEGYPVLSYEDEGDKIDLTDQGESLQVGVVRDADYDGSAVTPTLRVLYTHDGQTTELYQNSDFKVIVSPDAINRTLDIDRTTGTRPYVATIQGVGRYSGTPAVSVKYGIVIGDLSTCVFVVPEQVYTGQPLTVSADDVTLLTATGAVVDPSTYSFVVNKGAVCINRGAYEITATATGGEGSNYLGSLTAAAFNISPADLNRDCTIESISANGVTYEEPNATSMSQNTVTFVYTGSPILPAVDAIVYHPQGAPDVALRQGESLTDTNGDFFVEYRDDNNDFTNASRDVTGAYAKRDIHIESCWPSTIGNYHNYVDLFYQILPANIADAEIVVPDQAYTGAPRGVTVINFNGKQLVEGVDYTVTYANNVERGAHATASITGIGNFTGSIEKGFTVLDASPTDISTCTIAPIEHQSWTGASVTPVPVVTNASGDTLTAGVDYVVSYANNIDGAAATDENAPTVTVYGAGMYAGELSATFDIVAHKVNIADRFGYVGAHRAATLVNGEQAVINQISAPKTEFTFGLGATVTLEVTRSVGFDRDCNLTGVVVRGALSGEEIPVTVTSVKNQTSTSGANVLNCTFEVPDEDVVVAEMTYVKATRQLSSCTVDEIVSQRYTGSGIVPDVTVRDGDKVLEKGVDYDVFVDLGNQAVDVGPNNVTLVGMGSYTGRVDAPFEILPLGEMTVSADAVSAAYDGTGHGVVATASVPGAKIVYGTSAESCTLSESPTFTQVGSYTVYLHATAPGYIADGSATVTITPRAATVRANDNSKMVGGSDPVLTATVDGVLPGDEGSISYTLTREPGEAEGDYAITPGGEELQGNYQLSFAPGVFTIVASATQMTVSAQDVRATYDKSSYTVVATASVPGAQIKYGTEQGAYTLDGAPAYTNAGTYTVYFEATKEGYDAAYGSATIVIDKAPITITVAPASKIYGLAMPTESELSAQIDGLLGSDALVRGADYDIAVVGVGRTSDAGVYEGVVRAALRVELDNYEATIVNGDFTVNPRDLADVSVQVPSLLAYQDYTGNPIEPVPDVYVGTTQLEEGRDFVVEYQDSSGDSVLPVEAGLYTLYFNGLGNYTGVSKTTTTFYIIRPGRFSDVDYGSAAKRKSPAWYAAATDYVADAGVMTGIGGTTKFGVGQALTRAQMASVLYKYEGQPSQPTTNQTGMKDVKSNDWYTMAANWAVSVGVINGKTQKDGSALFDPSGIVTFEQMLAILANYIDKEGAAVSDVSMLNGFKDANKVSDWARPSVAWAYEQGIFSGSQQRDGLYINAKEGVKRERAAAVLMNAIESGVL